MGQGIKSPTLLSRPIPNSNNFTPDTAILNGRYRFFYWGRGQTGRRLLVFVSFAWGSVYRFPFVSFVALFWNREWFNTMTEIWGLLILVPDILPQNNGQVNWIYA